MAFGLCNAAQAQQRLVDTLFGPEFEPKIFTYLDDIIVATATFEEHVKLLGIVKNRLQSANLTINASKCEFFKTSLVYLGFVVGQNSLRTDPNKVSAMINYPRPTNVTEVRRFMGLCSWYRRFIKDFSTLMSPVNDLIKGKGRNKKQKIEWTPEAEQSFLSIKQALVSAPILCQPDFTQKFTIQCDASDTGLGGVLTQTINDEERVIAYASRALSRTERNYSVTEKELLAVIFSIDRFRAYVEGTRFSVITDHYSLLWLNNMKNPTGKLARWAVKLRQHSFDLIHRQGSKHVVPDALSRIPPTTPEISLIDIAPSEDDNYYLDLKNKIVESPDTYPQWKVENEIIYKLIPNHVPLKTNLTEWKMLVPKSQRYDVIQSCHDPPTKAHFGFSKTLHRVQELYYWPRMRYEILKYIRNCKVCGAQKITNFNRMGLMGNEKNVCFPFQVIAVDLMGPFPRSSKGHCHLLVITDFFTKYTLMHPLRNATANAIVTYMENEVFLVYGVPQIVLCDNGTVFAGTVFKKLMNKYEVQKIWFNPRYSPQCNFVERYNQTIGTSIRCYVKEHKDWDLSLHQIQQAINTAKHEVTGYAPCLLNFGRNVPLSGRYYGPVSNTRDIELMPDNRNDYVTDLSSLKDVFVEVRKKLHAAYLRNARAYNLRKKDVSFNVGDKVWRRNKVLSDASKNFSSKLAPKYILCTIREKHSRLVYSLNDDKGRDLGRWHIKDMKPYLF